MTKILVPVDAGQPARLQKALAQAIRMHQQERAAVHLLSVQPRLNGHVAMFFGTHELSQLQHDAALEELQPARDQLDAAGVPYTFSILVGRSAETIAAAARELACDRVVFGEPHAPAMAEKLFGSVGSQVRHLLVGTAGCEVIGA